jgi:hypothetical protein
MCLILLLHGFLLRFEVSVASVAFFYCYVFYSLVWLVGCALRPLRRASDFHFDFEKASVSGVEARYVFDSPFARLFCFV